jgi:hypothetical protein
MTNNSNENTQKKNNKNNRNNITLKKKSKTKFACAYSCTSRGTRVTPAGLMQQGAGLMQQGRLPTPEVARADVERERPQSPRVEEDDPDMESHNTFDLKYEYEKDIGPYGMMLEFYEIFRIIDPTVKMTLNEFEKRLAKAQEKTNRLKHASLQEGESDANGDHIEKFDDKKNKTLEHNQLINNLKTEGEQLKTISSKEKKDNLKAAKRQLKNEEKNIEYARKLRSGYNFKGYKGITEDKLDTKVQQDKMFSARKAKSAAEKSRYVFSKVTFNEQCIDLLQKIVVDFLRAIKHVNDKSDVEDDLFEQKYITFILEFLFLEKSAPIKGNYRVFYVLQHASTFKLFSKIMESIITKLINESTEVKTGNNIDEIINENYFNIIKEKLLKFLNDYYYGLAASYNTFSLKKRFGPVSSNVNKLKQILESDSKNYKNSENSKGNQVEKLIYEMFSNYGIDSRQSFEDKSEIGKLLKLFNNTPKVKEFHDQIMNAKNVHEVNYVLSNYLKNDIDFNSSTGELRYKLYGNKDDFQVKDVVDADYIQSLTDELAKFAKKIPKQSSGQPLTEIEDLRTAIEQLKKKPDSADEGGSSLASAFRPDSRRSVSSYVP